MRTDELHIQAARYGMRLCEKKSFKQICRKLDQDVVDEESARAEIVRICNLISKQMKENLINIKVIHIEDFKFELTHYSIEVRVFVENFYNFEIIDDSLLPRSASLCFKIYTEIVSLLQRFERNYL